MEAMPTNERDLTDPKQWTEEEQHLVDCYMRCVVCGAPRTSRLYTTENTAEVRLVCLAD